MSRRLVLLNVLLVVISAASMMYIAREITAKASAPGRPARGQTPPATSASATPPGPADSPAAPGSYTVVASRNLFSPSRSEAPAPLAGAATAPPAPKPNLYGVVVRDGASIAYLEDPATKRVAGYRAGDSVAGGTVQLIAADRVVLNRPEGRVEVRLSDPAKPRPPAPASPGVAVPGAVPGVTQPAVPRFQEGVTPPGQPGAPTVQPPVPTQPTPPITGRRPLPPNLRRTVPGAIPDAPPQ